MSPDQEQQLLIEIQSLVSMTWEELMKLLDDLDPSVGTTLLRLREVMGSMERRIDRMEIAGALLHTSRMELQGLIEDSLVS